MQRLRQHARSIPQLNKRSLLRKSGEDACDAVMMMEALNGCGCYDGDGDGGGDGDGDKYEMMTVSN